VEIVDDLSAYKDKSDEVAAVEADAKADAPLAHIKSAEESLGRAEKVPLRWQTGKPVLCIPGIGPLDEAFTLIVAQSIGKTRNWCPRGTVGCAFGVAHFRPSGSSTTK
jgi:hypothetical protein